MSGPKGASYNVESQAELQRRALAASRERLAAAKARLAELQADAGPHATEAGTAPALPASDVPAEVDAQTRALREHCNALEAVAREYRVSIATGRLQSALADFSLDLKVTGATAASSTATVRAAHHPGAEARSTLEKLARHVATLPTVERESYIPRLAAAAKTLDGPDPARSAQAVDSLRAAVATSVRAANERASFERRRAALAQDYADLATTAPDTLQTVAAASTDRELARMRAELDEARGRATRAADQSFVISQAEDVLRTLGYRVEVSQAAGLDEIVARKDNWRHHGLRLLFPESQAVFSSIPEAYGATNAQDDLAFERESCGDISRVLTELRERGVRTELRAHKQPGTVPMRRASADTQEHKRRLSTPRERAL